MLQRKVFAGLLHFLQFLGANLLDFLLGLVDQRMKFGHRHGKSLREQLSISILVSSRSGRNVFRRLVNSF